ncbi:MAG: tetratricopeptide repeat protein [Verrucomicrobia bacterium]|nr:tetratricopeptide repeat protein [Verrucomicrobiota bacterium]
MRFCLNASGLIRLGLGLAAALGCLLAHLPNASGAEKRPKEEKPVITAESVLREAQTAYGRGDKAQALSLINKAVQMAPDNSRVFFARARYHSGQGESAKAVEDFDKVLKLDPSDADSYQLRAIEHFLLSHIADAVTDFNQYVTLVPSHAPYDWQRGIALYYGDKFAEGRQQFEQHQTVNAQDVENAAWHYFCISRLEGPEKARVLLLPVSADSRVPMMEIYALLQGSGSEEKIMAAAAAGNPSPATLNRQLFYAHLYLALYYEAHKDAQKSAEHTEKAAALASKDDYMGKVALVHAKLRKQEKKRK